MAKRKKSASEPDINPEDLHLLMGKLQEMMVRVDAGQLSPEAAFASLGHQPKKSKKKSGKPATVEQLLDEVYETNDPEVAYPLLLQGYALEPDNDEVLKGLAYTAPGLNERLRYKESLDQVLRKQIPDDLWKGLHGKLWLEHRARPYLVNRLELAIDYHNLNRFDDAIETARNIMQLNTNDNQGVREYLLKWYMDLGRFEEAKTLIHVKPDDGLLVSCYNIALLQFRDQGDSAEARRLLKAAKKRNKHVPALLLGDTIVEEVRSDTIAYMGMDEAQLYAQNFRIHWVNIPGALEWLQEQSRIKRKLPEPGFTAEEKDELLKLPQVDTGWVIDSRPIPKLIKKGKKILLMWTAMVLDAQSGFMIANQLLEEEPSVGKLLSILAECMREPMTKQVEPQRPADVIVIRRETNMLLGQYLKDLNIGLIVHDTIKPIDDIFDDMVQSTCREELRRPALCKITDVTPEELDEFYQNASDFYRQAPWLRTVHERLIRIECPLLRAEPYYATLMGTLGITPGIAVYFEEAGIRKVYADQGGHASMQSAVMRFDYPFEIAELDLININRQGFTTPGVNIYPNLVTIEQGLKLVQPSKEALLLVTLLAQAVPQLVQHRKLNDGMVYEYVDDERPERQVKLSWVQDVPPW